MSDLIERLRREGYTIGGWDEALSELEAKQAEIAEVVSELSSLNEQVFSAGLAVDDLRIENADLKEESQRLRDLVKAAFHEGHLEGVTSPDMRPDIAWQNSEARTKLENGE